MIQLRLPQWPRATLAAFARQARVACAAHGARLLLNGDAQLAMVLGLDGVHLPARVAAALTQRTLPADRWLGVSCHDAAELLHAVRIGADFATLSPVFPTPAHADSAALGWDRFADLVLHVPIPVYALGGLEAEDVDEAWMAGAQGIAAIRGFWA
jgi:8-oxo-dGTP diphosphatase